MAKSLLWLIFVLHFIAGMIISYGGGEVSLTTTILSISILAVLAICESIESLKRVDVK